MTTLGLLAIAAIIVIGLTSCTDSGAEPDPTPQVSNTPTKPGAH